MLSLVAIPAKRCPRARLNALPRQVVTIYVGKGASTCSTKIKSLPGTWNVVATCSWKNPETACATGLFNPKISVNIVIGSFSRRAYVATSSSNSKTS